MKRGLLIVTGAASTAACSRSHELSIIIFYIYVYILLLGFLGPKVKEK